MTHRILQSLLLAATILCLVPRAHAADFSITNLPTLYTPGVGFTLFIQYAKPASTAEQRLVFIIEVRRVADDSLILKLTDNNANLGHKGTIVNLSVPITVPLGTQGDIYFALYAVPWSLNRMVVDQYKSYPTNGTWTYSWNAGTVGDYGVTQPVTYLGTTICPDYAGNTTYCSGVAFETCVVPYNAYNATYGHPTIGTMTVSQMQAFRRVWYGITDAEKLAALAIPQYNLGVEITDWNEVQEGDFCQLWRTTSSGHNPIFVSWVRDSQQQITGIRYWGSQGSTNGIGTRNEFFSDSGGTVRRDRIYFGRLRKPRDNADYLWAITTENTKSTPTRLPTGEGAWISF